MAIRNERLLQNSTLANKLGISANRITPKESFLSPNSLSPWHIRNKEQRLLDAAMGKPVYDEMADGHTFNSPAQRERFKVVMQEFDADDIVRVDQHRLATGGKSFLLQNIRTGQMLRETEKARISRQSGGQRRSLRIAK